MGNVTVKVTDKDKGMVQISNVRLGFKSLWGPNMVKGKNSERHTAQFLFKADEKEAFEQVLALAKEVFSKATGGKGTVVFNDGKKRDGEGKIKWDGERFGIFEDSKTGEKSYCLRTTQPEKYDPKYIDSKGRVVREFDYREVEDKIIYAGCRVNVKLQYKASMHDGKMTLWPNIIAIQFAGHDTSIGGLSEAEIVEGFGEVEGPVNEETGFGEVDTESSELDISSMM